MRGKPALRSFLRMAIASAELETARWGRTRETAWSVFNPVQGVEDQENVEAGRTAALAA